MSGKLTKTKLEHFNKLFAERREEILNKVKANSNQEVDTEGDDVDVVQATLLHELATKLSGRDVQMLKNINAALERIKDGTFGICEECEEPIGEKRLTAMPHCILCISCQEQTELEEKQFLM